MNTTIEDCATSYGGSFTGPLYIDYEWIYKCGMPGYEAVSIGTNLTFQTVSQTADAYFSPTLAAICEKLKLPYDVAGVTFLAFGNGAPDVFSSIAGFSTGSDALIGLGSLLGASMFISALVVGLLSYKSEPKLSSLSFSRDVLFHFLAVALLAYVCWIGEISMMMAWSFIALYFIYVTIVLLGLVCKKKDPYAAVLDKSIGDSLDDGGGQVAWLDGKPEGIENDDDRGGSRYESVGESVPGQYSSSFLPTYASTLQKPQQTLPSSSDSKIVVIEDYIPGNDMKPSYQKDFPPVSSSSSFQYTSLADIDRQYDFKPSSSDYEVPMRGFSPFYGTPLSEGIELPLVAATASDFSSILKRKNKRSFADDDDDDDDGELKQKLIAEKPVVKSSRMSKVWSGLYWEQWRTRRRLQRQIINSDWYDLSWYWKVVSLVEIPFTLARVVTIPAVEKDSWTKMIAVVQPITCGFFLLFLSGAWNKQVIGHLPLWGALIIITPLVSFLIYVLTHESHPPKSHAFSLIFILVSFLMCIAWIYVIASEMISAIDVIGHAASIPASVLGLTVLAWGNSFGDLMINLSISRQGFADMAVAGCYGGPIFNILIGLGISLVYSCSKSYPKPFVFEIDVASQVSIAFLMVLLSGTLIIVSIHSFSITKWIAFALIGSYILYTAIQIIFIFI